MSLKQEIETWVSAVAQYDNHEFEEALKTFDQISDTSKIQFNCGVIHATLGEHDKAVECYQRAIRRDNYLAVAYFQQGVSNFLAGDFEEALVNFNDALKFLRGNRFINYDQLGLKFRLFSCEVLFNRGLCYIYLQQKIAGLSDLHYASKEKVTPEVHDVIYEAIKDDAEGYTVFSIPVGVVYRPNSAKVKNLKTKDYLGKARLIAASDLKSTTTGGTSAGSNANAAVMNKSEDDRPLESISFGASNLVKPGLHSRSRQQSEPPINRNMFPPTPPPEQDPVRTTFAQTSTTPPFLSNQSFQPASSPSKPLKQEPLNLNLSQNTPDPSSKPRIGTTRTASEPRGPSNAYRKYSSHEQPRRLFMEAIPQRPHSNGETADVDEYPEELYQVHPRTRARSSHHSSSEGQTIYQRRASSRTRNRSRSRQRRQHYSIDEEPSEDAQTPSSTNSDDQFEILHNAGGQLSRPPPAPRARSSSRRGTSRSRRSMESQLKNIRIKVHCGDDTRYMMLNPEVHFRDFVERVREKFGLKAGFKCKVRDEGDLITMGDKDDWEMAIGAVRKEAMGRDEGAEMGKMEVWVVEVA